MRNLLVRVTDSLASTELTSYRCHGLNGHVPRRLGVSVQKSVRVNDTHTAYAHPILCIGIGTLHGQ